MSTTASSALADLNDVYTDAVNRAVAEDRMDLVALLEREFDQCLEQLGIAC
jgi:hypothetical protein